MTDTKKRVVINLHPQTYARVQVEVRKLNADRLKNSAYSMQRYIEEAILRRLSQDWKRV